MACFTSEAEVKTLLMDTAKLHDASPDVITARRTVGKNTVQRKVSFVIRATSENEALFNAVTKLTLDYHPDLWVDGSEINMQGGEIEICYITVVAIVQPIFS